MYLCAKIKRILGGTLFAVIVGGESDCAGMVKNSSSIVRAVLSL
jgi:hypothetical protein